MAAYTEVQDKVLAALHRGEAATHIDGRKVRSSTFEALERRGALHFDGKKPLLTERGETRAKSLSENLVDHRPNRLQFRWFDHHHLPTFDVGQCDYAWWDRARRAKVEGFEIAGLFLKPIASKKAAWVLGSAPQFRFDDKQTQEIVNEWFREHHADILMAMEESVALGDYYIVVDPDESITILTPDAVEPIVDEKDYSKQVGWRIKQAFSHPQRPWLVQTVIDEYYTDRRVRTVIAPNGIKGTPQQFENPTGLIPIIHIANNRHGGEMFGHPEAEALVQVLHNYGEVSDAATEGNLRQGRPTPTFEKLGSPENLAGFLKAFARQETRTLPDGKTEQFNVVEFSSDQVVYLGDTGEFKYASPGQFTGDTMNILRLFFYLVVQHTELPEFVWGNAIQGNQASAENTQLPSFTKWAEKEQGRAEKWLIPLIVYITALKSLYDRKVKYNADVKPKVKWMPLTQDDGKLTLEAIKVALTMGGWEPEWVVQYMPLDIDNPEEIIAGIIAQKEERRRLANGEDEPFIRQLPAGSSDDDSSADESEPEEEQESTVFSMRRIAEAQQTGAMVAFEIPLDAATNLVSAARQAGIEPVPPEDMHITLAFVGEVSAIEDKRDALEAAIEQFASKQDGLEGVIGGIGRFNGSETSGGQDVIYASFDSPALPEFRQALVEGIEKTGIEISRMHGFTPHITLAYVDKGAEMPNLALETIPLRFEEMVLAWGDERKVFGLRNEEEASEDEQEELVII